MREEWELQYYNYTLGTWIRSVWSCDGPYSEEAATQLLLERVLAHGTFATEYRIRRIK